MNQLSLRNSRFKFKTSWNLPTILEECVEYTSTNNEKIKDVNM